ncbi:ABC transporter permease [Asanoa sp. NPDC049518]|uniref:ABC transporter permease n=1 Tax=unclassified Asanoa TaxID=2685164 RepID=UPI00342CB239
MFTDVARRGHRTRTRPRSVAAVTLLTFHGLRSFVRSPVAAFFTVGLPVVFLVLLAGLFGNEVVASRDGVSLAQSLTPALAVFGAAQAAFCLLAAETARLRENGVFKRLRAAPVAPWTLLAGRLGTSTVIAVGAAVLVFAVGVACYGVDVAWRGLPAAVVTLVVGVAAFAALGLAVVSLVPGATAVQALTNGLLITLAFVSDVFLVGARMPESFDRLGWVLPLRHFAAAMFDATNLTAPGSGFRSGSLLVLAAWGVAGGVVAVRRFSWESPNHPAPRPAVAASRRPAALHREVTGHPSLPATLGAQVGYAWRGLRRDGSAVFFALIFPVILLALFPVLTAPPGAARTAAAAALLPGMATYGLAVTVYSVIPSGIAQARERRALARLAATPMAFWAYVTGRVVVGLAAPAATALALSTVAVAGFGVRVDLTRLPTLTLVFMVAGSCFAALGFAVLAMARRVQTVIAVTLGSLLSLSFISDVFVVGAAMPDVLEVTASLLPLEHAAHAMATAFTAGGGFPTVDVLVLLAWTAGGLLLARRIHWVAD